MWRQARENIGHCQIAAYVGHVTSGRSWLEHRNRHIVKKSTFSGLEKNTKNETSPIIAHRKWVQARPLDTSKATRSKSDGKQRRYTISEIDDVTGPNCFRFFKFDRGTFKSTGESEGVNFHLVLAYDAPFPSFNENSLCDRK